MQNLICSAGFLFIENIKKKKVFVFINNYTLSPIGKVFLRYNLYGTKVGIIYYMYFNNFNEKMRAGCSTIYNHN